MTSLSGVSCTKISPKIVGDFGLPKLNKNNLLSLLFLSCLLNCMMLFGWLILVDLLRGRLTLQTVGCCEQLSKASSGNGFVVSFCTNLFCFSPCSPFFFFLLFTIFLLNLCGFSKVSQSSCLNWGDTWSRKENEFKNCGGWTFINYGTMSMRRVYDILELSKR